jgi:Na+-translocating ferredoxin:NAD+ oxidoreductase subunit G
MSEQAITVQATPTFALIRALGIVAAICGLVIVGAYQGTFDGVENNKRIRTERAVFAVFPSAKSMKDYYALPDGRIAPGADVPAPPAGAVKFYATYDESGKFVGVAAEGAAKGYADTVRVLYAYDAKKQAITGIGVVNMRETPGIGDKIYTDKSFLANFEALDVKLKDDLSGLANEIKTVKHGTKTQPWQIDAISGATITSRAVGKGINDSAQVLLPKLVPNIDKLRNP